MLQIDCEQNTYASEISGAISLSLSAFVTEPEGSAKKWSKCKEELEYRGHIVNSTYINWYVERNYSIGTTGIFHHRF